MPKLIEWIIIVFLVFLVVVIACMLYGMIIIGDEEEQHDQDEDVSALQREWQRDLWSLPWDGEGRLWAQEVRVPRVLWSWHQGMFPVWWVRPSPSIAWVSCCAHGGGGSYV